MLHRGNADGKIKITGEKKDSDGNALGNRWKTRRGWRQQERREVAGRQKIIRTGIRKVLLGTEMKQLTFFFILLEEMALLKEVLALLKGKYHQTRIMDLV